MPIPLELTPQAQGTAAELRAWITTLRRMLAGTLSRGRQTDQAIEEAIRDAEAELRRAEDDFGPK